MSAPTPPAPTPAPSAAAPAPVTPVAAVPPVAQTTQAPQAPAVAVAPITPPTAPAPVAAKVKIARWNYVKARFKQVFGRMRRHIAFFILCSLFSYTTLWMFANAWQQEKAGENENWFHEGLFLCLMVMALIMFYFRLYRKSEVFQTSLAKHEAAEKAATQAKMQLEEEQKKQAFMGLIKDFQAANTYEQKSSTMAKLLTVGLESSLLRQQAIDLLCELNQWMADHQAFLSNQNLIVWRLKSSLFENSERFPIDSATQDLSIKSVNIIEAIVKKHLIDFSDGRTKEALDLSNKMIPTLTLTAQSIPAGSINLAGASLWQASFSETKLKDLSFAGADLQAASFWRAQMENVDFGETNIKFSKLRTNLQDVLNLTAEQFFSSKEWELCYLSPEQQELFFSDPSQIPSGAKEEWDSAEPRRRKLYFHLLKQAADSLQTN